jgi:transcriptional regulator with XRE-family HTH domain
MPGFDPARLRELRVARSLSIRDVADFSEVTDAAVQKWEKGVSVPDPRHAARLAEILGVAIRDLTTLTDEQIGLFEARALQGFTLRGLAERLSVSRSAFSNIEAGRRKPSPELAEGMATLLDLSVEQVRDCWLLARRRRWAELRERLPSGAVDDDWFDVAW